MFTLLFSFFQKPPPPLPEGWVQKWNHRYHRAYYVDIKTGRWQWEAPTIAREQKTETLPSLGHACDKRPKSLREDPPMERTATRREGCAWAAPDSEIDQVDRII